MTDLPIECPNCGAQFELNAVLTDRIRDRLKGEVNQEMLEREQRVLDQQAALKQEQDALDSKVAEQVRQHEKEWLAKAEAKLQDELGAEMKTLQERLAAKEQSIKHFQEQELALRKQKLEVEESRAALELDLTRKLDEEREAIKSQALTQATEAHKLKDLEKDRKIKELTDSLDDANRKAQQGSMESQGEVLEELLETRLPRLFVHDEFNPVPKGVKGADLVQVVRTPVGEVCGAILWEAKNTKSWSKDWIPKLKEDLIQVRGHMAILVSRVLPEGIDRFGVVDQVWVTDEASAYGLVTALRGQLLALARERTVLEGQQDKMAVLYHYLMGSEFKQKIEAIVEAFTTMQDQIAQERRAMEKQWKSREKAIDRVMKNTAGLHGDIQGIAGGQLPAIPALELDAETEAPPALEAGE